MRWTGKLVGALIGLVVTHSLWGAVIGAFICQIFDQQSTPVGTAGGAATVPSVFFRTTFELMGHVAKSDGRVSEAEIDAARRMMRELRLAPEDVASAIACFRAGKSQAYNFEASVERLREACGLRYDLLSTFMELQISAALAGNGMPPPARLILTRVAERLGMSGLEFVRMEAAIRSRRGAGSAGGPAPAGGLSACYAELEVDQGISDQELKKAYRRQMSRHHPDKLVANGLPESMAQMAKEKTQRIQEAYEAIRTARGMR